MPELPEVETVIRYLAKVTLSNTLEKPIIYWKKCVQTDFDDYLSIEGRRIVSLSRKGKFILFHLDDSSLLLFHLRMEGKLFVVDKTEHDTKHLSLFIPFENKEKGLAFYDTRKFGVTYHLKKNDPLPTDVLGKEPFDIDDIHEIYPKIHSSSLPIKDLLLDQTIMAGIGNIYASEICFASQVSPLKKGKDITEEECKGLLKESKRILQDAIDRNGSTVHSYLFAPETQGSYQDDLMVYSRTGKECRVCHKAKIESHKLKGRSTFYCPICQHTGITIGITGKIGSGKSLVTSYFKEAGYLTFSCDECVHSLYKDKDFLLKLKSRFPMVFNKTLSKKKVGKLLVTDKKFKRDYELFLYKEVRARIENFIIDNDNRDKAIEVPLLFDAHMEQLFTYLVGTETSRQRDHLLERGDKNIESRIAFNTINSYDKNRSKLDYIITTDGTKEELKDKVFALVNEIKEKTSI